jgi:arylsulfatase A-like enzyme
MNLLFVFADELRAQSVSCDGNPEVQTPVLDRLATEGVVFDHAYSTTPVCTPARASMLTGCWPRVHKAAGNDLPIDPAAPSIARALKASGYVCGYDGKWHLGGFPRDRFIPPGAERLGFDDFWSSWNCSHQYMWPRWHRDTPEVHELPGRYEPEVQTDLAIEWLGHLRVSNPDQPFCLFVSYGPPHEPYRPTPPGMEGHYDPKDLTVRPNVPKEIANAELLDLADYYGHITALDRQLGRLVEFLEQHDILDDTLVAYSSDHGTMLGSHGLHSKQVPFEEAIAIPLVMRGRSALGPLGRHDDLIIGMVDIAPTLLGLLGIANKEQMQGLDLSAHIADPTLTGRPSSLCLENALVFDNAVAQGIRPWWGVRTDRYTYARHLEEAWLLFDNEADPYQMLNLVDASHLADVRAEMDGHLKRWSQEFGEPIASEDDYAQLCGVAESWRAREEWFRGT